MHGFGQGNNILGKTLNKSKNKKTFESRVNNKVSCVSKGHSHLKSKGNPWY